MNCDKCGKPLSSESFRSDDGDFLGWFCTNPECEDFAEEFSSAVDENDERFD